EFWEHSRIGPNRLASPLGPNHANFAFLRLCAVASPCVFASLRPSVHTPVFMTTPTFAPRPDELERRAQLAAMKRTATGLLVASGVVLVAASLLEARYPWLG